MRLGVMPSLDCTAARSSRALPCEDAGSMGTMRRVAVCVVMRVPFGLAGVIPAATETLNSDGGHTVRGSTSSTPPRRKGGVYFWCTLSRYDSIMPATITKSFKELLGLPDVPTTG